MSKSNIIKLLIHFIYLCWLCKSTGSIFENMSVRLLLWIYVVGSEAIMLKNLPKRQHLLVLNATSTEIANCIYKVAVDNFKFGRFMGITSSFNMTSPTAEIEKAVLFRLHSTEKWILEVRISV